MAKRFQFDDFETRANAKTAQCTACEEMLTDALDGSLGEADRTWFDGHVSTCGSCSEMLADAQRGAAWLEMLKTPRPEPSARLVERILAQTTERPAMGVCGETAQQPQMVPTMAPLVLPLGVPGNLVEFRPRTAKVPAWAQLRSRGGMFEPRLAMTAAMAFFSIALTLNLTGVQLNRLNLGGLKPANLKRTYYTANADAARYYDNLRVVRVLESRVDDLREAAADRAVPPAQQPTRQQPMRQQDEPKTQPEAPGGEDKEKKPGAGPGMSRRAAPMSKPEVFETAEPVASVRKLHGAGGLAWTA